MWSQDSDCRYLSNDALGLKRGRQAQEITLEGQCECLRELAPHGGKRLSHGRMKTGGLGSFWLKGAVRCVVGPFSEMGQMGTGTAAR